MHYRFWERMNREYHSWWSWRLNRSMELFVFGHSEAKVLIFPTRDGRNSG